MRARHRAEREDQRHEARARRGRVLQQLQPDVSRREPLRRDAGADHDRRRATRCRQLPRSRAVDEIPVDHRSGDGVGASNRFGMPPRSVSSTLEKSWALSQRRNRWRLRSGSVVVVVGLARVEDDRVVEQLDVAGLEVHLDVEDRVVRDRLDQVHRRALIVGEARHLRRGAARRGCTTRCRRSAGVPSTSWSTGSRKNGSSPGDCSSLRSQYIGS